jgi:glycosyltransferase involved in cell wall biosynthesis
MKIIHVVANDYGGAGRAAKRIVDSLNLIEEDAQLYAEDVTTNNTALINRTPLTQKKYLFLRKLNHLLLLVFRPKTMFSIDLFGANILRNKDMKEADILHLHWVNAGVIPFRILKKIGQSNIPVVWTFHDMNPFTGGCHYDQECNKYQTLCTNCPLSGQSDFRLPLLVQKRKANLISNMNIVGVGCSTWITNSAKSSTIFSKKKIIKIGNTLNFKKYKPQNKEEVRSILGINTKKKIVLFGAIASDKDKRKGLKYLVQAINSLPVDEYAVAIFGNSVENIGFEKDFEIYKFGNITNEDKLIKVYNSADVFVAPSIQENLSNAVMEALACGTPVVAFDIGGMSDMIIHNQNGYLASPFSGTDLAKGIKSCANNQDFRKHARKIVMKKFNQKKIATEYRDLYREMLQREEL